MFGTTLRPVTDSFSIVAKILAPCPQVPNGNRETGFGGDRKTGFIIFARPKGNTAGQCLKDCAAPPPHFLGNRERFYTLLKA